MSDTLYIQEDIKAFLKEKSGDPAPRTFDDAPAAEIRAEVNAMFALLNTGGPVLEDTKDITLSGAFGARPARLYKSAASDTPQPCMIYFHGGGWIIGDLESEDRKLRHLAEDTGMTILSVDYVLAPEYPFPGPGDDCLACARDALARADELGIDPTQIVLGGASAGANLALVTALAMRDAEISLAGLVLFYGAFDLTFSGQSMELLKDGFFLDKEGMYRFRKYYCPDEANWMKSEASPLFGDFTGLPRTFISAPSMDPLFNDSTRLDERMKAAGVETELKIYKGAIHGFTLFQERFKCAREGVDDASAFLNALIAK